MACAAARAGAPAATELCEIASDCRGVCAPESSLRRSDRGTSSVSFFPNASSMSCASVVWRVFLAGKPRRAQASIWSMAGERGNLGEKLLAACGGGFGGQNRLRSAPGLAALSAAADRDRALHGRPRSGRCPCGSDHLKVARRCQLSTPGSADRGRRGHPPRQSRPGRTTHSAGRR